MTPRLFVRKAAKADVVAAFDWYEHHRPGLGLEFADEVEAVYTAIESQPLRFPLILDDIRIALLRRFPCAVRGWLIPFATRIVVFTPQLNCGR